MTGTTTIEIINRNDTRRHIVVMTCGNSTVHWKVSSISTNEKPILQQTLPGGIWCLCRKELWFPS